VLASPASSLAPVPMRSIRTAIHIDARPDAVWRVLTDFDRYPDWNPFMPYAEGAAEEGKTI